MKQNASVLMKKTAVTLFLVLCLLLSACSGSDRETEKAAGDAPVQAESTPEKAVTPGGTLLAFLSPFENILSSVRASGCRYDGIMIPEQKLKEAAGHLDSYAATPKNGHYSFDVTDGGTHEYSVWGQDVLEELATPVPYTEENEQPDAEHMEIVWGDTVSDGGGKFVYRYVYDISEDMKRGASEMTAMLDGSLSGHERFDWCFEDGCLIFADAVLDGAAMEEGNFPYITVRGVITPDGLKITEYSETCVTPGIPASYLLPSSQYQNAFQDETGASAVLKTENGTLYETTDGNARKYTLK